MAIASSWRFFLVTYSKAIKAGGQCVRAGLAGLACAMLPVLCLAQEAARAISPAGPLDLTRPQFDTETPQYDVSGALQKADSTVLAEVNGRPITLADLGDAIRAMPPFVRSQPFNILYPTALNRLIMFQALAIRATTHGVDKEPVVQRRVTAAATGALINELLEREAAADITEKMILDRYDTLYAGKPGPEEVHLLVILVGTETEANALIAELAGGGDFPTIAKRSSRDTSGPLGGDIGYKRRENLTAEVGAVAFALAPGQLTPHPVQTAVGWFVLRIEDRRRAAAPLFATMHEPLYNMLVRERIAAIEQAAMNGAIVHTYNINGATIEDEVRHQH